MATPLALPGFLGYFPPAVAAKVYIMSFRSRDDRRPSKFIVLADNMKSAIEIAWEHGGSDFQSRFDKSTLEQLTFENLYVVDASVLPSAGAVNTGLTIAALALRAGDFIAGCSTIRGGELTGSHPFIAQ